MGHAAFRHGVIVAWVACCAPLLGCAEASGASAQAAAAHRSGPFDGKYQGRQFPSSAVGSMCHSQTREVWFEVEGDVIELRHARHRHDRRKVGLLGTVSTDGSVVMRRVAGGRSVAGRIVGDRLTAATMPEPQEIQAVQAGAKLPCGHRYEASKVGS